MEQLRVVVADDESIIRLDLKEMLERLGHRVIGEASEGITALQMVREMKPDLAVLDIKMPGGMDGIDVADTIAKEKLCPVILLTAYSQRDLIERASSAGVYAYLVKPFQESDVEPGIEIAMTRYNEFVAISQEAGQLQDALDTRKMVDRAKGILMDRQGLSEQEAFRRIQVQSMNSRKPMKEIAEAIVITSEVEASS